MSVTSFPGSYYELKENMFDTNAPPIMLDTGFSEIQRYNKYFIASFAIFTFFDDSGLAYNIVSTGYCLLNSFVARRGSC